MVSLKQIKERVLWAVASSSALFLVFFRARWAMTPGIYDDQCYLEWLHKLLSLPYPRCYSTSHLPGVAIQWIPMAWLAKFVSQFTMIPFQYWLEPLIGLQTFVTWGVSLLIIQKIFFQLNVSFSLSKKIALIFLLNIPALEFLTQFNFTTVGAELLLSSLIVFLILKRKWILALGGAVLLNVTRINDPMVFLLIGGALLDLNLANKLLIPRKYKIALVSLFSILVILVASFSLYIGLVKGYNGVFLTDLFPRIYPYRWWRCFFMGNWGLFWTAPAGILGFLICSIYAKNLSWFARAGLLWVFSEIVLIVVLNELRADYINPPWRYIIGSLIGMIPALVETASFLSNVQKRWAYRLIKALAIWQVYLAFVTHSFTILNYWRVTRWVDNWSLLHYVYLLRDPGDLIKLLYVSPVGFTLFSWFKGWSFFQRYQSYVKYAVQGPALYVLTVSTFLSVIFLTLYLINKITSKQSEML